jgi:hypothetical protein
MRTSGISRCLLLIFYFFHLQFVCHRVGKWSRPIFTQHDVIYAKGNERNKCLVFYGLVWSGLVWFVRSIAVCCVLVLTALCFGLISFNLIQIGLICPVQSDPVRFYLVCSGPVWSVPWGQVWSSFVWFCLFWSETTDSKDIWDMI